jgi:glycosyltransferase involved in cell wall biosynthesis
MAQLQPVSQRLSQKAVGLQLAATLEARPRLAPLRIVLVMLEPPLPFGHALGRWYYVLLRGLVERGHAVTAFIGCSSTQQVGDTLALFPPARYDMRCHVRVPRSGISAKWRTLRQPYSYMIDPVMLDDIEAETARGGDVLHLEGIWSGWAGKRCKDRSQIVLSFHSLYDIDQELQPVRGIWDWLHRGLRRTAEHRLLRSYDRLITLSTRLQEAVAEIVPSTPVSVVPLGMDCSIYPMIPAERRPAWPLVTLIGSMDWLPSRSAAERLLTRLWPSIKAQVPQAKLQIVGWHARRVLSQYAGQVDITIVENVPETKPYFEAASIFLYAPERGSGMKVKVLEAFAYGVPVVTTSEGVEGIPAEDGVHASICEDDAGLIERTVALLNDPARQKNQRIAARALLETHCSPAAVLDKLEACYADMVSRRGRL